MSQKRLFIVFVASQGTLVVKNPPDNAGDASSIPGSERRVPGGGNGTLLQSFCLENPTDRGACQATICRNTHRFSHYAQRPE